MDFVWQYIYGPSAFRKLGTFNELEYSIKSVMQNVKDARCIVVGDEPRVSMDVIHIPGPPQVTDDPVSRQKQHVDKIYKMTEMANNPIIGDEFVLMYDDVFIMQPTTIEELKINWARAEIVYMEDYLKSGIRKGDYSYRKIWRSTYEFIKMDRARRGEKTYDWETHTPRYLEKAKLKALLDEYDLLNMPMIVTALYDGLHAHNTQIINSDIQADLWTHKPGMDFDKELSKQYLNIYDDVIVPEFIEKMKKKLA